MPSKAFWNGYCSPLQPILQVIPVHALVDSIAVRGRILMISHPVEGEHSRVVLAYKVLANVIDAVLVMPPIHFWDVFFHRLHAREDVEIMILLDIMKAVDAMSA